MTREQAAALVAAQSGDALEAICLLARERDNVLEALRVIAEAASEKSNFWPARRWLDERDIYNGDLSGKGRDPVIETIARAALKETKP